MNATLDSAMNLLASDNPKSLGTATLQLAHSTQPEAHKVLFEVLISAQFLNKLDSADTYAAEKRLRIWRILDELAANPALSAKALIVSLTQESKFLAEPARVDRLIMASASVRPAPPEIIVFWNDHWVPDDGYTPLTVAAVVENSSETALALLERKLVDSTQRRYDQLSWIDSHLRPHRNEHPILRSCERLVHQPLDQDLRIALLRALFEASPLDEATDFQVLEPPPRAQANVEALALLRRIGIDALKQTELPNNIQESIQDALNEIAQF